jgi:hypothetical protein
MIFSDEIIEGFETKMVGFFNVVITEHSELFFALEPTRSYRKKLEKANK